MKFRAIENQLQHIGRMLDIFSFYVIGCGWYEDSFAFDREAIIQGLWCLGLQKAIIRYSLSLMADNVPRFGLHVRRRILC